MAVYILNALGIWFFGAALYGQENAETFRIQSFPAGPFISTAGTAHLRPIQSLNKTYRIVKSDVKAPFVVYITTKDTLLFSANTSVFWSAPPKDTTYLYWEYLSPGMQIWVNKKLLFIARDTDCQNIILPVYPSDSVWVKGKNTVLLRRESGANASPNDCIHVPDICVYPGWILSKTATADSLFTYPVIKNSNSLIVGVVRIFEKNDFRPLSDSALLAGIKALKDIPNTSLSFEEPPSLQKLRLFRQLGIPVTALPREGYMCVTADTFVGSMPKSDSLKAIFANVIFLKKAGINTIAGKDEKANPATSINTDSNIWFTRTKPLLIAIIPILILVFWRIYDSASFLLLVNLGYQTSKSFELISQNMFVRQSMMFMVTALRILLLASVFTYWYMFHQIHEMRVFWPFTPNSYLGTFLAQPLSIWQLFGTTLFVLLITNVVKYFVLAFLAQTFNRRYFVERLLALEAYMHLPWLILLFLMGFIITVVPRNVVPTLYWTTIGLSVFYVLRKYYLLTQGLSKALKVPVLVNILYICTLEFLPWFWILL